MRTPRRLALATAAAAAPAYTSLEMGRSPLPPIPWAEAVAASARATLGCATTNEARPLVGLDPKGRCASTSNCIERLVENNL